MLLLTLLVIKLLGLSLAEIGVVLTLIAAVGASIATVLKLPSDKGTLRIDAEQGAMMMRDNFITALQRELERRSDEADRKDKRIEYLEAEVERLRARP